MWRESLLIQVLHETRGNFKGDFPLSYKPDSLKAVSGKQQCSCLSKAVWRIGQNGLCRHCMHMNAPDDQRNPCALPSTQCILQTTLSTDYRAQGPQDPLSSTSCIGFWRSWRAEPGALQKRIEAGLTVTLDTWQLPLISPHRPEEELWAGPPGEGGANQRDDRSALSPPRGSSCGGGKPAPPLLKEEKLILPLSGEDQQQSSRRLFFARETLCSDSPLSSALSDL